MGPVEIIIIIALAAAAGLAVRSVIKRRGGCSCGCGGGKDCPGCAAKRKKEEL
ncbi:MAG: hypothetical protein IKG85_01190 [Clostridia bacterium]|nr:hypothetical protein [Clostridia bacterium]